jgi:excisionase family DNA binding protein
VFFIMNHFSARDGSQGVDEKATAIRGAIIKRYYRVDEVARYFSVSYQTIYRLIDMGDLKAIRLRGSIRVPAQELRAFEERQNDDS